jgi:hypothetical protein
LKSHRAVLPGILQQLQQTPELPQLLVLHLQLELARELPREQAQVPELAQERAQALALVKERVRVPVQERVQALVQASRQVPGLVLEPQESLPLQPCERRYGRELPGREPSLQPS